MKQLFWRREKTSHPDTCQLAYICRTTESDHHLFRGAHAHPQISEITFILSGKGHYFLKDHFFPVNANDVMFCSPGLIHEEGHLLPSFCIGLYGNPFANLGDGCLIRPEQKSFLTLAKLACRSYQLLANHHGKLAEQLVLNVIMTKLSLLARQPDVQLRLITHTQCPQKINIIKEFIDHHFHEHVSIAWLSNSNNSSRSYIEHRFKDHFHCSPITYLTSRRIGEAQTILICYPAYPITHLAFDMGFSSLPQFDHVFAKITQISPSAYRTKYAG